MSDDKKENNLKILGIIVIGLILLFIFIRVDTVYLVNNDLDVNIQDYYGEIVSIFKIKVDQQTTLAANTVLSSTTVLVTDSTGCLADPNYAINIYDNESFYQGIIQVKVGNTLTISPPLDKSFNINNSFVECGRWNMNINGLLTPTVFSIHPPTNRNWHIESDLVQCKDNSDWDINNFCGRPALSNGLTVRVVDGYTKNLFLIYDNGGFGLRGYDLYDYTKAPSGVYGYTGKLLFEENYGAIIKLEGSKNDTLEYEIRNDLTSLIVFASLNNGHVTLER